MKLNKSIPTSAVSDDTRILNKHDKPELKLNYKREIKQDIFTNTKFQESQLRINKNNEVQNIGKMEHPFKRLNHLEIKIPKMEPFVKTFTKTDSFKKPTLVQSHEIKQELSEEYSKDIRRNGRQN